MKRGGEEAARRAWRPAGFENAGVLVECGLGASAVVVRTFSTPKDEASAELAEQLVRRKRMERRRRLHAAAEVAAAR